MDSIPGKYKLPDMGERCRICLIDHGCMTSLNDEHVETRLKDLSKCTSIDIKHEEHYPNVICHVCLYKLNMWKEFKEQFIQSNKILLGQLISEVSDTAKDSQDDKRAKIDDRKRQRESNEHTASDNDKKKSKTDTPSSQSANIDHTVTASQTYASDNNEQVLSKDSSCKIVNISDDNKSKENAENVSEGHTEGKSSSGVMRMRLLPGRRGRTTERRKASTKRWVERKKALLAATGENVSDTDSVASDNAQLSPVQKARAKTNADKEAERQKQIVKSLKNLETSLTEKYAVIRESDHNTIEDTDSDARKAIFNKDIRSDTSQENNKNLLPNQTDKQDDIKKNRSLSQEKIIEKENSSALLSEDNVADRVKKAKLLIDEEIFIPHSLKSELIIGNATYVVTSTLILAEPQYLNKANLNNITKDSKSFNIDENSQEKNTDIIDAVQLRRIHPTTVSSNNKRSVERCLNIEVEGTEVEALKRVQIELAGFVEKEMKHRLFGTNGSIPKIDKTDTSSYQKLDQQLKSIVEKAIKKNIESSVMKDTIDAFKTCSQKSTGFPLAFVKMAANSSKFQPKVMVKRLDITKENKLYKINNAHALKPSTPKTKLSGPFSAIYRKRQSVFPIKYNDYNTSALDSDSNTSDVMIASETSKPTNTVKIRTYGNLGLKQYSETNNRLATNKLMESSSTKTVDNNTTPVSFSILQDSTVMNEQKPNYQDIVKLKPAITENHICGVCRLTFNRRKDVEAHVRNHKPINIENATPRHNKHKIMRCKRCHEIVEARFVKAHVCKTARQIHKCYVCNSTFRTEKLLIRHLESHDQSEFNIENVAKVESKKPSNIVSQKIKQAISTKSEKDQGRKTESIMSIKAQNILTEKNDIQPEEIVATVIKANNADTTGKPKETYTCFVCDKIFTDEEILKDHLQKHCDDLSEGEQSTCKEQYQCAICGDTLDSDHALEEHVGKHLFDDEDDNPNLISIGHDDKTKNRSYHCGQCSERFDSEMLLEMHMPAHEEEAAIAEWEKQGMKIYQYQCMLCDQLFDTEEELAEHLNVHDAHVCQLCDKPFRTLEDLQEHVATH